MANTTIIFASHNAGKIRELQALFNDLSITLIPQSEMGISSIEETGLTFVENALLKARHACHATGLPAIADDSGLVVPALQGAPGIFSARYAGDQANAAAHIAKLLDALKNTPLSQRHAYFYCAMVYLSHAEDPTPLISEGSWHGSLLETPQGTEGFGYDPIFYVPTEKCSAAQLTLAIKNRISHRSQALQNLIEKLSVKVRA